MSVQWVILRKSIISSFPPKGQTGGKFALRVRRAMGQTKLIAITIEEISENRLPYYIYSEKICTIE